MDSRGYNGLDMPPRALSFLGAGACGFLALIITISLCASLFGVPNIKSPVGDFFADSYGVLSFIISGYFIFAAVILLDKNFRPRLIFILNGTLFPFLTLAAGFSFLRDYQVYANNIEFFNIVGRNAFSFIVVTLTMLECGIIYALAVQFFPEAPRRQKRAGIPEWNISDRNVQERNIQERHVPEWIMPEQSSSAAAFHIDPKQELTVVPFNAHNTAPVTVLPVVRGEDTTNTINADAYVTAFNSLDKLNAKLETLSGDMGLIDAQCNQLDTKITSLSEWLTEDDKHKEIIKNHKIAEIETSDLEYIISEAEEEARRKTEAAAAQSALSESKKKTIIPQWTETPSNYSVPVEGLLDESRADQYWIIDEDTKHAARILTETLREFRIEAEVTGIRKGPVITMFEILPSPGVKLSKIVNLQDNIALRLAAASVRIVAPIPGKHAVGIEIPNKERSIVSFREIIEDELEKSKAPTHKKLAIPVVLGKDITGNAVHVDLAATPHLLIAGSTGSGKSVCVNTMILSILYQCPPSQCKLILIDPKIVELKLYNDIPHLLTPVITEPKRAFQALQYCICEMERRYACLDSVGVRDIKTYNKRIKERKIAQEYMPYIVVVIDEFADLMATTGKELESTVARLAAMSRAVGIHLVLATQRPSIDVITGLIKSNIPSRIAFMVASMMDSRIIIDTPGAEKLLGKGDMLYSGIVDPFPVRMQGAFVSEDEVERVVDYVRGLGAPDYIDEEIFFDDEDEAAVFSDFAEGGDPLFEKAIEVVSQQGKASASYIQRRLKIGYNRAARLVEEMEHRGIVGPSQGSKPRELLKTAACL